MGVALVVNRIVINDGKEFGECLEYEMGAVDSGACRTISIQTFDAPGTIEAERSLIYVPLSAGVGAERVIGVLKVASLQREGEFSFEDLCDLRSLSASVNSVLGTLHLSEHIKTLHEQLTVRTRVAEQAQALFYYRHAALGLFHSMGHVLGQLGYDLLDAKISASDPTLDRNYLAAELEKMIDSVNEAKKLIRTAKERGGKMAPTGKRCALVQQIIRPALEDLQRRYREDQCRFKHSYTGEEYLVWIDSDLFRESITNVLNNAVKAVQANVAAGRREVSVYVRPTEDGRAVEVRVSDTGVGIPAELVPRVFEPYFTTRGGEGGSGLGLYFAKQLVEQFDGEISIARSLPGKGTEVRFVLPRMETSQ